AGALAVLADVGHHLPGDCAVARAVARALCERDVPPGRRTERGGVVVGHAGEAKAVIGQLVPLLASDLARLAADAERGVGEEAERGHGVLHGQRFAGTIWGGSSGGPTPARSRRCRALGPGSRQLVIAAARTAALRLGSRRPGTRSAVTILL